MINQCLFSTGQDNWETPQQLFDKLNSEFGFTLDVAATLSNAKCEKYFTAQQDGLIQDWSGEVAWCNPPYSRAGKQDDWIRKCHEESKKAGTTVVALIPARTDTARFHEYILGKAEIRFIRGRLNFELGGKPMLDKHGRAQSAPFPSMICVWR